MRPGGAHCWRGAHLAVTLQPTILHILVSAGAWKSFGVAMSISLATYYTVTRLVT